MSNITDKEISVDSTKRDFMAKAGKYAVVGAGMATLMTPTASTANVYNCNNGNGNGEECSPNGMETEAPFPK